jgi:hypothetical protein
MRGFKFWVHSTHLARVLFITSLNYVVIGQCDDIFHTLTPVVHRYDIVSLTRWKSLKKNNDIPSYNIEGIYVVEYDHTYKILSHLHVYKGSVTSFLPEDNGFRILEVSSLENAPKRLDDAEMIGHEQNKVGTIHAINCTLGGLERWRVPRPPFSPKDAFWKISINLVSQ